MVTPQERQRIFRETVALLKKTNLALTPEEIDAMDLIDFGLGEIDVSGG